MEDLNYIIPSKNNYKLWLNGFDQQIKVKRENPRKRIFKLISISSLTAWKNVNFVIEVFNSFIKKGYDAVLIIIGDGNEYSNLKKLVEHYGIDKSVIFTGRIEQKKVYEYLNDSDVFLNFYDKQNLTNTMWEAMSMDNCVITRSKYINNKTMIRHRENGYLFSLEEKEQIVDCIIALYENRELLKKMKMKAKESMKNILPSWDDRVYREYRLIEKVIKGV